MPYKVPDVSIPVSYHFLYPDASGGDRVGALSRIDGALVPIIAENIEYLRRRLGGGIGSSSPLVLPPSGIEVGQGGEIQLMELAAYGVNYVSLISPDSLPMNYKYVLPASAPTDGQVLIFDGANNHYPGGYFPLKWSTGAVNLKFTKAVEIPNGSRKSFSVVEDYISGTLVVFVDGEILADATFSPVDGADYSVSGRVVTFTSGRTPPHSWVGFLYATRTTSGGGGGGGGGGGTLPVFLSSQGGSPTITGTRNGVNTIFTTSINALTVRLSMVWVDDMIDEDAVWIGTTLTPSSPPLTSIRLLYWS